MLLTSLVFSAGAAELSADDISPKAMLCVGQNREQATWFRVSKQDAEPEQYLFQFQNTDTEHDGKWVLLDKVAAGTGFNLQNGDGVWLSARQGWWGSWTFVEIYPKATGNVDCWRKNDEAEKVNTTKAFKEFSAKK